MQFGHSEIENPSSFVEIPSHVKYTVPLTTEAIKPEFCLTGPLLHLEHEQMTWT